MRHKCSPPAQNLEENACVHLCVPFLSLSVARKAHKALKTQGSMAAGVFRFLQDFLSSQEIQDSVQADTRLRLHMTSVQAFLTHKRMPDHHEQGFRVVVPGFEDRWTNACFYSPTLLGFIALFSLLR